ncbi:MAG: ABC transporter permease subunit [Roseburia sp.]|nr:ABC transporter permease subunit [Roseburia sp.]MCM1096444.1 ABC transporter permease subunit [Ruminococcus flavefaciens]
MRKIPKGSSVRRSRRKSQLYYHSMMLPGIAFLLIFSYVPMIGLIMAFQDFVPARGLFRSKFVGLKHFRYMLSLPDFSRIIRNTLVIALSKIVIGMVIAILFAILLNEIRKKWLKKSVQTIVYLPHFLSWVVLATVVTNLFNLDGLVNSLLAGIGLEKINFLGNVRVFPGLIIGTDVWKEFGYNSIVYLAAITAIDPGLHEAAAIDGASWWQRVWHITLPGMLPIILLMTAMNLTSVLSAGFDQIYNLYSPLVYETGDVLDTYVYRIGLVGRQYSFGTAVGLARSAIGMILLTVCNRITRRATGQSIY